jgi:hypothetical protein
MTTEDIGRNIVDGANPLVNAVEGSVAWLQGKQEINITLPPDETNAKEEYLATVKQLDEHLANGQLDPELFVYAFGRGKDLQAARNNFWIAMTKAISSVVKNASTLDYLNDPKLTSLKEEAARMLLRQFDLVVPTLSVRDPLSEWGWNIDGSTNFPLGVFADDYESGTPFIYPLEQPMPEIGAGVSDFSFQTPSVLLLGKESLQQEFIRFAAFTSRRADRFAYGQPLRSRRLSIHVLGNNEPPSHAQKIDELFLVQLRMDKKPQVSPGGFDTRPHKLVIIDDLDAFMSEADDIRLAPLLSLLNDPDPRVHIIATASPDGMASQAVKDGTLRFDWNLFGASKDLPLAPHQFGFVGGEPEKDLHLVWIPKI